ncbi:MAG TPA: hypothetical protein RMH85_09685 [Polyangiaceae bacterium LLY-WYZ-15_(1-7)]|nr:hypothetical protein [Sandaracinus sp.]HJL01762.1 hypothetical protein [Polyangiaceae bacterium LLY-WYZ-15_(1-7)]HJL08759.1 hypothetical protein [Polyangiaceae bacterium LLY-WYZ-15_(1-7)]HJL23700.1 hypothetical protein [Polyangiaceae bacterium LLY-WYZ-15_(1-7)]HJL47580.1 hypothetical protein [Polyangiaceae bacterium LLY-WYZ-15_(1-7)]
MRPLFLLPLALSLAAAAPPARALPTAPERLCATFPDAADCRGRVVGCETCHTSTWPAAWNGFGVDVGLALPPGDFSAALPAALESLAAEDADGDGVSNLDELLQGTNPGDPASAWPYCAAPPDPLPDAPVAAGYDFRRAYQRLSVLYCGRSPSYDALAAFDAVPPPERHARLHAELDACLQSAWWRDEGLPRLADARIRPLQAVGADSPVGIVIGDYEWDYRLWSWVLTGGRDVRDLLLADYHVERRPDGSLARVEGLVDPPAPGRAGGQPLVPERRAGMITTQWFMSINTMFSPLPRTTAAQAYRAYLGMDIARLGGIVPVAGEPLDVDAKGVREAQCAGCHSTLDPLSYAFAEYDGIRGDRTGAFVPQRPALLIEGWDAAAPETVLFGQPVSALRDPDAVDFAEVAAESDAFMRNLGRLFFRHAFERDPTPRERPAFDALWAALPEDGWSADALIHRLVDLDAFGGVQ